MQSAEMVPANATGNPKAANRVILKTAIATSISTKVKRLLMFYPFDSLLL
jgi:hypothetical protein